MKKNNLIRLVKLILLLAITNQAVYKDLNLLPKNAEDKYEIEIRQEVEVRQQQESEENKIQINGPLEERNFQIVLVPEDHKCQNNLTAIVYNNGTQLLPKESKGYGHQYIILQKQEMINMGKIIIEVKSQLDCKSKLHTNYIGEVNFELEQDFYLIFYKPSTEILRFKSPENINDIEKILITFQSYNIQKMNDRFKLSIKKEIQNDNGTVSNVVIKTNQIEISANTQGFILQKINGELIENQTYNIVIEAQQESIIVIRSQILNQISQIQLGNPFWDLSLASEHKQYIINLDKQQEEESMRKDLVLDLSVYSGLLHMSVYLNNDILSVYNYFNIQTERIVIEKLERNQKQIKQITIKIQTVLDGSYYMEARFVDNYQGELLMNKLINMKINSNEILEFNLKVETQNSVFYQINTHSYAADGLQFIVYNCTNINEKCQLNQSYLQSLFNNQQNNNASIFRYEQTHFYKSQQIQLTPLSDSNFNQSITAYQAIAIYNSKNVTLQFSILPQLLQSYIQLFENQQHHQYLQRLTNFYCKFDLNIDTNVQSVQIQLSSLSGRQILLAQKDLDIINETSKNIKQSFSEHQPIIFDDLQDFKGTYYIKVQSLEQDSYVSIYVILNRNQAVEQKAIKLRDGKQIIINSQFNQQDFYRFSIQLDSEQVKSQFISVNIHSIQSHFKLLIKKQGPYSMQANQSQFYNQTWQQVLTDPSKQIIDSGSIQLDKSVYDYKEKDIFNIIVMASNSSEKNKGIFELQFTSTNQMQQIKNQHTYHERLESYQTKYYSFTLSKDQNYVIQMSDVNNSTGLVIVQGKISQEQQIMSNYDELSQYISDQQPNYLEIQLKNQTINKVCNFTLNLQCGFYLQVFNNATEIVEIKMEFFNQEDITYILDGSIYERYLEQGRKSYEFIYLVTGLQNINIQLRNFQYLNQVNFYVNIIENKIDFEQYDIQKQLPSKEDHQFESNENMYYQKVLKIQPDQLKSKYSNTKCEMYTLGCSVYIRVEGAQNIEYKQGFILEVVESIHKVQEDKAVQGYVDHRQMEYYVFESHCKDCQQIVISVNAVGDGDVDLYVNYRLMQDNVLPIQGNSTYYSTKIGPDDILIQNKKINNTNSLTGFYYIGVYGFRNATFNLYVTQGNFNILKLYQDSMFRLSLIKKGQTIYFQYYSLRNEQLRIFTSSQSGDYTILVTVQQANMTIAQSLPCPMAMNYFLSTQDKSLVIEHPNTCERCYFIIAVFPKDNQDVLNFKINLINHNGYLTLESGQPTVYSIKKNIQQKFQYISLTQAMKLDLVLFKGNVQIYLLKGDLFDKQKYKAYIYNNKDFKNGQLSVEIGQFEQEMNADWTHQHKKFILVIEAESDSMLKVVADNGVDTRQLLLDSFESGQIKFITKMKYHFDSVQQQNLQLQLYYQVQTNKYCSVDQPVIQIFSYNQSNKVDQYLINEKDNDSLVKTNVTKVIMNDGSIILNFQAVLGQYYFLIDYKDKNLFNQCKINFNIQIQKLEIKSQIQMNTNTISLPQYSQLKSLGDFQSNIFQMLSFSDKKLYVQMNDCFLPFSLSVFANKQDFLQNKPVQTLYGPQKILLMSVQNLTILQVQRLKGNENKNNKCDYHLSYLINSFLLDKETEVPEKQLYIPNSQVIQIIRDKNQNVILQIKQIRHIKENMTEFIEKYKLQRMKYIIVLSEDEEAMQGIVQCNLDEKIDPNKVIDMEKSEQSNVKIVQIVDYQRSWSEDDMVIKIERKFKNTVHVGVRVEAMLQEQEISSYLINYYYPKTSFDPYQFAIDNGSGSNIIILMLVFVIIGVMSLLIYLCSRNRQITQKLKYEMTDIRNIAFNDEQSFNNNNTHSNTQNINIRYEEKL